MSHAAAFFAPGFMTSAVAAGDSNDVNGLARSPFLPKNIKSNCHRTLHQARRFHPAREEECLGNFSLTRNRFIRPSRRKSNESIFVTSARALQCSQVSRFLGWVKAPPRICTGITARRESGADSYTKLGPPTK